MVKYTDVYKKVVTSDYFLYLFIGGRGIGKTYSALKGYILDGSRIMYVRRSETEIRNCARAYTNPFKAINKDLGLNINIKPVEEYAIITDNTNDEEGELRGYAVALSTFGKFRGADFSDVDVIIFDEFINTSAIDTLRGKSASLLFNLIETVNRNRELNGFDSIKVVMLSNANTIDDDVIRTLELASEIQVMKSEKRKTYTDDERGIYLELLENKSVRDAKEETRLYKLTKGTTFASMSLDNEFTGDFFGDVKRIRYNELVPLVSYDTVTFYKHKTRDIYLASRRKAQCDHYDTQTKEMFRRVWGFTIRLAIEGGYLFYTDYGTKLYVKEVFR